MARLVTVETETVHPRPGVETEAYIVRFAVISAKTQKPVPFPGAQRTENGYGMILRAALVEQIMLATETTDTSEWPGKLIVFEQATRVGKLTTAARAPRTTAQSKTNTASEPAPAPETQPDQPAADASAGTTSE
jgi:hypothetical protein